MSENVEPAKEPTEHPKQRRKLRNYIIKSRQQFRYTITFFGGGMIVLTAYVLSFLFIMNRSIGMLSITSAVSPQITMGLQDSIQTAMISVFSFSAFLTAMLLIIGLIITHRVFGPFVQIMRVLEEYKTGNFKPRIHLRKNDEFQDLANLLNEIADKVNKS